MLLTPFQKGQKIIFGRDVLNRLKLLLDGPAGQTEVQQTLESNAG